MTVPRCYPSVVPNTLEVSIEISVRVEVKFIINAKGTRAVMRGGSKVDMTPRTEVTAVITGGAIMMVVLDTVIETMGSAGCSVSLIDIREAICTRRSDVDMGATRGSGSRDRRELRTRTNVRTSRRGVTVTLFMTPLSAVVAGAVKGRPKRLRRMGCLWARS